MRNCQRHRANTPKNIYKSSYDDIIKSAKRKHSDEFFIFKNTISGDDMFSESSVDIFGCAIEHWKKINGRWNKE